MDLVVQFIVAVFATIAFAVLFSVPKKELAFCGFTGALGWIIYSVFMKFDMGIVFSSFIASKISNNHEGIETIKKITAESR